MSSGPGISIAGSAPNNAAPAETPVEPPVEDDVPMEVATAETDISVAPVTKPQRSVEGWVLVATGVHEEAREEDLRDLFSDYGKVRNLHLNLDRQTGYVKGYALIEYALQSEAEQAIRKASGKLLLGKPLSVDYAFVRDDSRTSRPSDSQRSRRSPPGVTMAKDTASSTERTSRRDDKDRDRERSPDRGF
ncbi:RNA-binding protein 8A [Coemansia sp. BCRC 34301]|nr:RNA-binding protein 8A [Coemansia sp. BCRC 34301]